MTAPCLCTADPCASFAAPICLDDSDCDSAATLLNPGGLWACAAHAATRPGPWRLVGPVACESDLDRSCERWQPVGLGRALVDGEGRVSRLEQGLPDFLAGYKMLLPLPRGTDDPPSGWLRRG